MKCWNCNKPFTYCSKEEFLKITAYINTKTLREKWFCSEKCLDEYLKKEKEDDD